MTHLPTFLGKKILITGASGFIGSQLLRRLNPSGAEIHAVSRGKRPDEANVRWWQADLAEIDAARAILTAVKPDLIFHLAGYAVGAPDLESVIPTFRNNLVSQIHLLTVVTELGCGRIIVAGSTEEPDYNDSYVVPSSPYATSKWAGSAYLRMFRMLYQLPVVNLQISVVYGPGEHRLTKLVPYVTLSLLQKQAPKISNGVRKIDWVYVDDVVDGLIAVAEAPNIEGSTIDLGSGKLVSVREVVQILTNMISPAIEPLFGALPDRPLEQIRVADIAETYALIGWKPKTSLEYGLKSTIDWYKERLER